jgi:hypothetical protein
MSKHAALSPTEAADRLAIRELIEAYAHCADRHVTVEGGNRRLMLASLRYDDTFVKLDGAWLFAQRLLYVDWVDERALS